MTTSKALSIFANKIENDDALNNPQEYLGPYTDQLLEFWSLLDTLTEDQWKIIQGRYDDFYNNQRSEWCKAADEAYKASKETIGEDFSYHAAYAALDVYGYGAAYWATMELIGGIKNPVILPMFDDL